MLIKEILGQAHVILVPQNRECEGLLREWNGGCSKEVIRYALKKEPDVFDRKRLEKMAEGLPEGFGLRMMDEELFWRCKETEWCRDWVSQYDEFAVYQEFGLGAVILKGEEIVSDASSYSG